MKKFSSIFLFSLLLLCGTVFAQKKSDKPHFWFGPKVGLDLATPTIDQNAIKTQFDSNAQVGVFFQFGRKLYLQPEFYYAMHKETNTANNVPSVTSVNTLKIPVMVGLRLINLGLISAHVMAGPQGSFFLNESNKVGSLKRQSSSFDLQFGAGVDVLGLITLDVRYSSGLSSVEQTVKQLQWKDAVNVTLGLKIR